MQDVVSFHDSLAPSWEAGYMKDDFMARFRVLSALLPQGSPGQRWLDAGCGTGTLSRWLARERGFSLLAIDASEKMLMNASPQAGVEYRQANVTDTRLPGASFDGVLCSSILEYLPSVEVALREFHRLLKPGGMLLASVPNSARSVRVPLKLVYWLTRPLGRRRWYTFLDYSKHCYSKSGFAEVLRGSGFSPERMIGFGGVRFPLMPLKIGASLIMASARKMEASAGLVAVREVDSCP